MEPGSSVDVSANAGVPQPAPSSAPHRGAHPPQPSTAERLSLAICCCDAAAVATILHEDAGAATLWLPAVPQDSIQLLPPAGRAVEPHVHAAPVTVTGILRNAQRIPLRESEPGPALRAACRRGSPAVIAELLDVVPAAELANADAARELPLYVALFAYAARVTLLRAARAELSAADVEEVRPSLTQAELEAAASDVEALLSLIVKRLIPDTQAAMGAASASVRLALYPRGGKIRLDELVGVVLDPAGDCNDILGGANPALLLACMPSPATEKLSSCSCPQGQVTVNAPPPQQRLALVSALLRHGHVRGTLLPSANAVRVQQMTSLLHLAAKLGDVSCLALLVREGGAVNGLLEYGNYLEKGAWSTALYLTPLVYCVSKAWARTERCGSSAAHETAGADASSGGASEGSAAAAGAVVAEREVWAREAAAAMTARGEPPMPSCVVDLLPVAALWLIAHGAEWAPERIVEAAMAVGEAPPRNVRSIRRHHARQWARLSLLQLAAAAGYVEAALFFAGSAADASLVASRLRRNKAHPPGSQPLLHALALAACAGHGAVVEALVHYVPAATLLTPLSMRAVGARLAIMDGSGTVREGARSLHDLPTTVAAAAAAGGSVAAVRALQLALEASGLRLPRATFAVACRQGVRVERLREILRLGAVACLPAPVRGESYKGSAMEEVPRPRRNHAVLAC
jgi:hypothetical protein